MNIARNLHTIKENINKALEKSNKHDKVELIVVSKNRGIAEINEVLTNGYFELGENRVQELVAKYEQLPSQINWHLIGHLQKNKCKYITDKVKLIHSIDKYSLAEELNKRMKNLNKTMNCLVQVNIAREESKFGLMAEEAFDFIQEISLFPWIKVKGLMTIVPEVNDSEEVRPYFREMYNMFAKFTASNIPNVEMQVLSMGMSNDYQIAVEEGANMVRIGSAVFR